MSKMPSLPGISPAFSERRSGTCRLRGLGLSEAAVRTGLGSWVGRLPCRDREEKAQQPLERPVQAEGSCRSR